ncbi:4-hydroxy-tetrahydrodipicolinate synthase [Acuticoccus sp. MNP-M23]|uniref:4-hydroxy-tetrahydrodipicolinate synthase n=1 Tax=Acuticoccus sp. MNP-M23 TaxID=3072793 RepID=UPI0028151F09|nr:4-hydroxy-tetrahydrodipicolinate synthase [Acuticoccus sp. MNP-M23]WMS43424.1 4-hydroxy-tetrahydrodipicolinate synthase [Acuticoccus sp. MNP-M23]
MFTGSITALVTPFRDGKIDERAFTDLIDWQIASGTNGFVPVGTTGESPTLSHEEHRRVVELCVETTSGRVPVIAGAGSNSTREAVALAEHAEKAGATGVLVVTPYYNKPSQAGLFAHFSAVAKAVSLPIIIYNIPPRSVVDMSVETMAALADAHPNIVGVKDATANLARVSRQRAACGEKFVQLSGEDATALAFNAHGGIGCISVTANVAPKECADFQAACTRGDYKAALAMQDVLMPLHDAMFVEPNPAGPKYALSRLGKIANELREPLVPVSAPTAAIIDKAMALAGLSD